MELTIDIKCESEEMTEGKSVYRVAMPGAGVPDFAIRAKSDESAYDALKWFIYNELESVGEIEGDE